MKTLLFSLSFLFFTLHTLTAQSLCPTDSTLHIVVLGSSTAAGAGANPFDSAWVNLYRTHLQTLNPDNAVSNLAQGGYSTFRLLPNGTTTPSNRPDPDTSRNITKALSLQPSAIIINLPSNDVSAGFSVQEQLDNFTTIAAVAQNANVPLWICTTQPKNYGGNATLIQRQLDVRDSILARYSPMVLDFWSGLAGPDNQIDPTYDSGDGTHLNNAGHYLLFTRARDANLPDVLWTPPNYVDYSLEQLAADVAPDCGIANSTYRLKITNRGLDNTDDIPIELLVQNEATGLQEIYRDTLYGGLLSCETQEINFTIESATAGHHLISATLSAGNDGNAANDVLMRTVNFVGIPYVDGLGGTTCVDSSLLLQANVAPGDSVRWYDAAVNGNLVGTGPVFQSPPLATTTSYFAEAIRGDFVEQGQLFTNDQFDRAWNGFMFDLIADSTLFLDSFDIKVDTFGEHFIDLYTRSGSHFGYELSPGDWDFLGTVPIEVSSPSEWTSVDLGSLKMEAGDSLAIYLQLSNPVNTLFYLAVPEPITRSTDELTLVSGTGISHNFSEQYFPRDWNGTMYYHYSAKPDGDCTSGLVEVAAVVSSPGVDLGNDTIISISSSILLRVDEGFAEILWSDGSSGPEFLLDGNTYGAGTYDISVRVLDEFGCVASDTIAVEVAIPVGTAALAEIDLALWPNPVEDLLSIVCPEGLWRLTLRDSRGVVLWERVAQGGKENRIGVNVAAWSSGIYILEGERASGGVLRERLVKL